MQVVLGLFTDLGKAGAPDASGGGLGQEKA